MRTRPPGQNQLAGRTDAPAKLYVFFAGICVSSTIRRTLPFQDTSRKNKSLPHDIPNCTSTRLSERQSSRRKASIRRPLPGHQHVYCAGLYARHREAQGSARPSRPQPSLVSGHRAGAGIKAEVTTVLTDAEMHLTYPSPYRELAQRAGSIPRGEGGERSGADARGALGAQVGPHGGPC